MLFSQHGRTVCQFGHTVCQFGHTVSQFSHTMCRFGCIMCQVSHTLHFVGHTMCSVSCMMGHVSHIINCVTHHSKNCVSFWPQPLKFFENFLSIFSFWMEKNIFAQNWLKTHFRPHVFLFFYPLLGGGWVGSGKKWMNPLFFNPSLIHFIHFLRILQKL